VLTAAVVLDAGRFSDGAAQQRASDLEQLREWTGSNGVAVPSRGRISQAVVAQYKSAGDR
jgi:hypothetical protein